MPTTTVNTFDTIEEWRLKTNELGVKIADLDNNLFTVNVIASGNITASGNINALGNVVVTRDAVISGNVLVSRDTVVSGNISTSANLIVSRDAIVTGNIVGASNAIITGNVIAANVLANVHYETYVTSKPAINVLFNANITGSANLLLSSSGTNILTISANVAADSVTLGTHTIGNYVKEISSADTSNIIVNSGVGEGTTPTVNLAMTNVTPGVYGNTNAVSTFTVTKDGRITNASNLLIDRAYALVTNKPSMNVRFLGNIVGNANLLLSSEGTNFLEVYANVAADSVTLGTHTVGDYVKSISSADTSNIIVNSGSGENSTPTVNLAMTNVTPGSYGNANAVSSFTVTKDGRLTASSNLLIDRAYILTTGKPSINLNFTGDVTGKANLNLSAENTNSLDVALTVHKPAINVLFNANITGSANVLLTNSGTNILTISANVANDSVTLGTHTVGDFVKSVNGTTGRITSSVTSGENAATVIDLATIAGLAATQGAGNANLIPAITYDQYGRITAHSNISIDRNYGLITNKPSINIRFTGNIVGNANLTISSEGTNFLEVQANLKTLPSGTYPTGLTPGTYGAAEKTVSVKVDDVGRIISIQEQTITGVPISGDYVKTVVGGTSITVTGSSNPVANVVTVNHGDTSTLSGSQGGSGIAGITVDDNGHVTGVTTATYLTSVPVITLGSGTDGNYTDRVVGGTGLTATGTTDEGNVITVGLTNTGVAPTTYGSATVVPVITIDAQGRITSASNVTISGVGATSSNVFSYFGAGANTISQTNATHSAINSIGFNFFAGKCAGGQITTGIDNIAFGCGAGFSSTTGRGNFFGGYLAGSLNVTGCYNTMIGFAAGQQSCGGSHNFFVGMYAGCCNGVGANNNTFIGECAGRQITTGKYNFFVGQRAGYCHTTGRYNVFLGRCTGFRTTAGRCNIFIGDNAGFCNVTGSNNIFIGDCAGYCTNPTAVNQACYNIFVGSSAGASNTTGAQNVFIGLNSGCCNTFGSCNLFLGPRNTGLCNTTGTHNIYLGGGAGRCGTTASCNIFFGNYAGCAATSGSFNVFAGICAGLLNTSGCRNIYLGYLSGGNVTTGNDNIILGNVTNNFGFANNTSNVIIMATGGVRRVDIRDTANITLMSGANVCFTSSTLTINGVAVGGGTSSNVFSYFGGVSGNTISQTISTHSCINTTCFNFFAGRCSGNLISTGGDNVFLGTFAGRYTTTGNSNNFFGFRAGFCNTDGCFNNFFGYATGRCNTIGVNNNFIGSQSGYENTSGQGNNFFGYRTGFANTTGGYNNFFGFCAGFCNTTGCKNNFFGCYSGYYSTTGSYNLFNGISSGFSNISGSRNIYLGQNSGGNVTTGNDNIIVGRLSSCVGLTGNTSNVIIMATGGCQKVKIDSRNNFFVGQLAGICAATSCHNVGVGSYTMSSPTYGIVSGCYNTAFGRFSLRNLTSGNHNVAIGNQSLVNLQNGNDNVAIGPSTLTNNFSAWRNIAIGSGTFGGGCITGYDNIAMGCSAGYCNTAGFCNIFLGRGAGYYNTSGHFNNFFGPFAGYKNDSGCFNFFVGQCAGANNTAANSNFFVGNYAGLCNTTGCYNTIFGARAGCLNTTGSFNTFIGLSAGRCNTIGCNNIFIGWGTGYSSSGLVNNTTENNRIVIGNTSHTVACIQIAWTTPSDVRDKCIFGPVPHGKSFLSNINPITFSFKNRETNELKETKKRYGFSAQEVLASEGDDPVIVGDENPDKLGLTHEYLIPILVNAVKELTKDVEDLRAEIAELKKSR